LVLGSAILIGIPDAAHACFRSGAATVRAGFVGPVGVGNINATRVRTTAFGPFGANVATVRQGTVVGPLGGTASYGSVRDRFVARPFVPVVGGVGAVGVPGAVYGARGVAVGAGFPAGVAVGGRFLTTLPAGAQRVVIRGATYYRVGGTYYQRVRVRGRWGYTAVAIP
jgi:hypothetical protein